MAREVDVWHPTVTGGITGDFRKHSLDTHVTHQSMQQQRFENQDKRVRRHHHTARVISMAKKIK